MVEWKTVQVPEELLKQADEVIKKNPLWTGVNEFVRDALREKIAKVLEQQNSKTEA